MRVEALRPEAPVERLNEGVVGRFSGAREVQRDALHIGPEIEIPADELGSLIDSDRLRIAGCRAGAFEGRNDVFGAVAEPRIERRREPAERIHDG
jgi:hypothetical protein